MEGEGLACCSTGWARSTVNKRCSNMASSEADPERLGVTDHPTDPSRAETGGGADGEKKKPTKRSDFNLTYWVSVLCCGDCSNMISFMNKCNTNC